MTDALPVLAETDRRGLYALTTSEFPLLLAGGDGSEVVLGLAQHVTFEADEAHRGEFKARTRKYIYTVAPGGDLDQPLVEWHWHPDVRTDPHMHVPSLPAPMKGSHLPSGRVSLEEVVRYLITDLGVPGRPDTPTALKVLDACQTLFEEYRTWPRRPSVSKVESLVDSARKWGGKRRHGPGG